MAGLNLNSELLTKYIGAEKHTNVVYTQYSETIKGKGKKNQQIILTSAINHLRHINKSFKEINVNLDTNGVFIGYAETAEMRKERVFFKYPFPFNRIVYFFDFMFHRVMPKLWKFTKCLYFFTTKGKERVLTKAEIFGRLYFCGFQIIDYTENNQVLTFVAKKSKSLDYKFSPSLGPVFKMKRIGKNGIIINVYKLRTMNAYSEYLQSYINEVNGLDPGGKFKDDFRVSSYGRFLRKYWIDELPMLINLIIGDIKLIGVRPLSRHYFELYSKELRQLRVQFKPGLIPPFYADLPKTLEEIMKSEEKYLMAFEKEPFKTDLKYFIQSVKNILLKRIRSK